MKPELESKLNSYLKLEKEISKEVSKHINGFILPNSLIERIAKIDGDKILLVKKSQEEIKRNLSLEEELSLKIEIENRLIKNSQKYRIIQISQHIAQVIFILSGIAVFITLENNVLFFIAIASILYAVGSHYYLGHIDEINSMYDELIGRKNE